MTTVVRTEKQELPLAFVGPTTIAAQSRLRQISREERWLEVLGKFPLDDRVLWTIEGEVVTLFYRVREELPDAHPAGGGGP